jgi:hypothetical protein
VKLHGIIEGAAKKEGKISEEFCPILKRFRIGAEFL